MSNASLNAAKAAKDDEFYTRLADIETELRHYKSMFADKVIYCNCDDPMQSNFVLFFYLQFEHLGLKKLIATSYNPNGKGRGVVYTGGERVAFDDRQSHFEVFDLEGDGDFHSEECRGYLEQADIVVTNPPFSLFRSYIQMVMDYGKKFIVIGTLYGVGYKEVFPFMQDDLMWMGCTQPKAFTRPDGSVKKFGNTYWYTNLPHHKRADTIPCYKRYAGSEEFFPTYDNYDAIEIGRVERIPSDYKGAMGVPLSFMCKFNPEQFEVVGLAESWDIDGAQHLLTDGRLGAVKLKGKRQSPRMFIRHRESVQ